MNLLYLIDINWIVLWVKNWFLLFLFIIHNHFNLITYLRISLSPTSNDMTFLINYCWDWMSQVLQFFFLHFHPLKKMKDQQENTYDFTCLILKLGLHFRTTVTSNWSPTPNRPPVWGVNDHGMPHSNTVHCFMINSFRLPNCTLDFGHLLIQFCLLYHRWTQWPFPFFDSKTSIQPICPNNYIDCPKTLDAFSRFAEKEAACPVGHGVRSAKNNPSLGIGVNERRFCQQLPEGFGHHPLWQSSFHLGNFWCHLSEMTKRSSAKSIYTARWYREVAACFKLLYNSLPEIIYFSFLAINRLKPLYYIKICTSLRNKKFENIPQTSNWSPTTQ